MPDRDWRSYRAAARSGLAVAVAVGLWCLAPTEALSIKSAPDAKTIDQQPASDQRNTRVETPIQVSVTVTDQRSAYTSAADKKNEDAPKLTDVILAVAAVGSLIFSALLWYSTQGLWRETKRLAQEGSDQHGTLKKSVRAARLANVSAWNAAKAAKLMATAAVASERAYIFPKIDNWVFNNNIVAFDFSLMNNGRTPALLREVCFDFRSTQPTLLEEPNYPATSVVRRVDAVISAGFALDAEKLAGPPGQRVFFGYVIYRDVMKVEHTTRFCVQPWHDRWNEAGGPGWNEWD